MPHARRARLDRFAIMRLQILPFTLVLLACGKDAPPPAQAAATTGTAETNTAPASTPTPAPARAKPAKPALPATATILPVSGPDACSLVPDDLLRELFGAAPDTMERRRVNARVLREDEHSTVRCEWSLKGKSAELIFGTEDATRMTGTKPNPEPVSGVGDGAWLETGFSDEKRLRVKIGDRFLLVSAYGLGEKKAASVKLASAAVAALPAVAHLADKLRAGDVVGAPAVKPCDLVSAEMLGAAAGGGGDFVTMPMEIIGRRRAADQISCSWVTKGERGAGVALRPIETWDDAAPRAPAGPTVAGHETRFFASLGEDLYVKMPGWTLVVSASGDGKQAERQARAVALAEAVLAKLP
jgi:hypothetical protein